MSAAANKSKSDAEAARLLAMAQLPPGATEIGSVPEILSGPIMGTPATSSLIDHASYWQVPMSFADAVAWVKAHPPSGLISQGSASGSGPSEQSGGYSYLAPDSPAWVGAALEIGVASVSADESDIRVDGLTEWLDPVPIRDTASGPRIRVTAATGCPATGAYDVRVRNDATDLDEAMLPAGAPTGGLLCEYAWMNGTAFGLLNSTALDAKAAEQWASAVSGSTLAHLDDVMTSCPADDGSVTVLAISYPGRADVDVLFATTGCQSLSNGHITATPGDALDNLAHPAGSQPPVPAAPASSSSAG